MNLSKRLTAIVNIVEKSECIRDVGCDHGYVSIALAEKGYASKIIASDINRGPLLRAKDNITKSGFDGIIETRLAGGLDDTKDSEIYDSIIIAGMGGKLMRDILNAHPDVLNKARQLVLQPQSEIFLVRRFLRENGFAIRKEDCVCEDGKTYFIIDAIKGATLTGDEKMQNLYDKWSEYLIRTSNADLKAFLIRRIETNNQYIGGMDSDKSSDLVRENNEMKEVLALMR